VLGIWLAQRVRSRSLPSVNLWLAVGACIVSFVVVWRFALPWYPASDYVMLPSLAAVVVAGAQYDSSGRVGWLAAVLRHRWSLYLGEVSFAFYLLHATVLAVIKPPASTGTVARCGFLLLALAVAALAAAALNRVVERPARVALLDLAARRRCRAAVVTAPVSPGGSPR
jgi:peptidoglycan/LPS O-acetylase OafA/YrhL